MTSKPVPDNYHTLTPYLLVNEVEQVIEFLKLAFDAQVNYVVRRPDGTINDAEVQIGDSLVLLGQPIASPLQLMEIRPMPASLYVYVPNCDAVYKKAVDAGGLPVKVPSDMDHISDRYCGVKDPGGNIWWIATHLEDLSVAEQERRFEEFARRLGPDFARKVGLS